MSPARLHRERIAALAASRPTPTIEATNGGGQPLPPHTPAREHRLTQAVAIAVEHGGALAPGVDPITAQIQLRLQHDLRRLKEIKSIDSKIAAKRDMLPEYRSWCEALLKAGRATDGNDLGSAGADDVLPTIMVWCIDIGDWPRALELAAHVLRFDVALPARYNRDAATLVLEEIATAALKVQARGEAFPVDVLEAVDELTAGIDMHDEPRAKLAKALGTELMRRVDAIEVGTPAHLASASLALTMLQRAQDLHERIGVKGNIQRLQKALAASVKEQAGTPPAA